VPPAAERSPVPRRVRGWVEGYLNTSVVMARLWGRLLIGLGITLPLAFWIREPSRTQALVNAAGLWIVLAVITRFFLYQFRLWRAAWVARRIDDRVPPSHPSREVVLDWIRTHSDGNYLHTLLCRLDAGPSRLPGDPVPLHRTFDPPGVEARNALTSIFDGLLDDGSSGRTQTQTYVTTQTQMLRDGEWVTVESSTSSDSGDAEPSEAIQRAMAILAGGNAVIIDRPATRDDDEAPPPGFEPIPVKSSRKKSSERKTRSRKRSSRKTGPRDKKYMPLQPDRFQPVADEPDQPAAAGPGDKE